VGHPWLHSPPWLQQLLCLASELSKNNAQADWLGRKVANHDHYQEQIFTALAGQKVRAGMEASGHARFSERLGNATVGHPF
jgi:hypothetical protein